MIRIGSSLSCEPRSGATSYRAGSRALSSDSDMKASRFTGAQDSSESVSPFKQHRRDELREDQQSEDPLYADPYPRLESSTSRKSVPEFLEDFVEEQVPGEEVTLTGRVRSKRVVGKSLIFLDIVNEFQKVQVMINKNKCVSEKQGRIQKFSLFKNLIQVGDHICRTLADSPSLPFHFG